MSDSTMPILSVYKTVNSNLSNLAIEDGQLIYVQDKRKIALDFGGKRTFYTQIEELATEGARTSMLAPVTGIYYFVLETAVLWAYQDGWVQITTNPVSVTNMVNDALAQAKASGDFKGDKGDPGSSGVYVGSGDMPDNCNVQIDPSGDVTLVPVRGVDYWTEEDKAEIISDVIAALPVYNGEVVAV